MRRILSCNFFIKHLEFEHGALSSIGHPVFWLVFLFLVSSLHFVFRLCTLFSHKLKCVLLELRCNSRNKSKTRSTIKEVMMQCYLGDWFLLHQLSKNVNGHFFHAFLEELEKHLPASNGKSGIV